IIGPQGARAHEFVQIWRRLWRAEKHCSRSGGGSDSDCSEMALANVCVVAIMMAANLNAAEGGELPQSNWWVARWSSQLASLGALILGFCGAATAILSVITISISAILAGVVQAFAACLILAIEGSSVVSFLAFAKPVGQLFENKPIWLKTAVYAVLTVLPVLLGSGFLLYVGFLISAAITALYGMLLIGRKGELVESGQLGP
ncbi:Calcium channel flower, partial [Fragariocoptes setiger]